MTKKKYQSLSLQDRITLWEDFVRDRAAELAGVNYRTLGEAAEIDTGASNEDGCFGVVSTRDPAGLERIRAELDDTAEAETRDDGVIAIRFYVEFRAFGGVGEVPPNLRESPEDEVRAVVERLPRVDCRRGKITVADVEYTLDEATLKIRGDNGYATFRADNGWTIEAQFPGTTEYVELRLEHDVAAERGETERAEKAAKAIEELDVDDKLDLSRCDLLAARF